MKELNEMELAAVSGGEVVANGPQGLSPEDRVAIEIVRIFVSILL